MTSFSKAEQARWCRTWCAMQVRWRADRLTLAQLLDEHTTPRSDVDVDLMRARHVLAATT